EPFRPMMMPGRAVKIVMRTRLADRSMSIREMPAWYSWSLMNRRIFTSSWSRFAYVFVANQRELHVRVEPRRKPIGCVFWPIAYFFSLALPLAPAFAPGFALPLAAARSFLAGAGGAAAALAAAAATGAGGRGAAGARVCRGAGTRGVPFASSLTPIVRWLVRCLMKNARPIARGCPRFIEGPPSPTATTTRRSSRVRTWGL